MCGGRQNRRRNASPVFFWGAAFRAAAVRREEARWSPSAAPAGFGCGGFAEDSRSRPACCRAGLRVAGLAAGFGRGLACVATMRLPAARFDFATFGA